MDRDEILTRSRQQKEDEGLMFIENQGKAYGVIGLTIMFFALAMVYVSVGGYNMNVPLSMMCAYQGAENFGKYSAGKGKTNLVWGIILSMAAVAFFMAYLLIDVLGVLGA